jgi:hypothetical protein
MDRCPVCLSKPIHAVSFRPCKHGGCEPCLLGMKECPLCRANVKKVVVDTKIRKERVKKLGQDEYNRRLKENYAEISPVVGGGKAKSDVWSLFFLAVFIICIIISIASVSIFFQSRRNIAEIGIENEEFEKYLRQLKEFFTQKDISSKFEEFQKLNKRIEPICLADPNSRGPTGPQGEAGSLYIEEELGFHIKRNDV